MLSAKNRLRRERPLETSDDEAAAAFALEIASLGSVWTTMRAYDREQMSGITERMGPSPGT